MITFPEKSIPVVTPLGDGYILYVKDNGMFEDDEITAVMDKDGSVRHFVSSQIKIWHNATYNINKYENKSPWERITGLRKHFSEWSNNTAEGHDQDS